MKPPPRSFAPTISAQTLRAFERPGLAAVDGPGGLVAVDVDTPLCTARIFAQGGQLARWAPRGQADVVWLSPTAAFASGKSIRGGAPVIFPWFGPHATDAAAPQHGFARTRAWRIDAARIDKDGAAVVACSLRDDESTRAMWPHAFELRLVATMGATLTLALTVTNAGDAPFSCEPALHTYFGVADVRVVRVRGLRGATYADKTAGYARTEQTAEDVGFPREVDRVYASAAPVAIVDDAAGRSIAVEARGASSTVVWNPGATKGAALADVGADAWSRFACVEAASVKPHHVELAPGASHTTTQIVALIKAA